MISYVKLTAMDTPLGDTAVWVNPAHVSLVRHNWENGTGSMVFLVGDAKSFLRVAESPQQVIEALGREQVGRNLEDEA